ncbi:MAG: hypothetical protein AAF682_05530 [Planctomycetota bacterium]
MLRALGLTSASLLLFSAAPQADFTERTKLHSTTAAAGDEFGISVDTDGKHTVVGARQQNSGPGKVQVFDGCLTSVPSQELTASDGAVGDQFGYSVAVDGEWLVVGAIQRNQGTGAAYVFRFDGLVWTEHQKLVPDGSQFADDVGYQVDVQDDLLAVSAIGSSGDAGAVYLYRLSGDQWSFEQRIATSPPVAEERLGTSISIDGDRIAIGAQYDPGFGRGYVYRKAESWVVEGVCEPQFPSPGSAAGGSIGLEGDHLLLGVPRADGPFGKDGSTTLDNGHVLAFEWDGSAWNYEQLLLPPGAQPGDEIGGWYLDIDGGTAAIAARFHDAAAVDAGAVFVYTFEGDYWAETQTLTTSDADVGDTLYSVALRGGLLVAGVLNDDDDGAASGSAYVFSRPFSKHGSGVPGAGGYEPGLLAGGSAVLGGTTSLFVRDFVGGAPSCYVISTGAADAPFFGGTLLVDGDQIVASGAFVSPGTPGDPAAGDLDLDFAVPSDPSIACTQLYVQAFAIDPAAVAGVSMTNAVGVFLD